MVEKNENRILFEARLKCNNIPRSPRVYFAGIGGIGMSGLAHLLLDLGWSVYGVDLQENNQTRRLVARGAKIFLSHSEKNIVNNNFDFAIYSAAVRFDLPDMKAIAMSGIPLLHRAEALAAIMSQYRGICVSGMHGKTTVSGMLSTAMVQLGMNVGYTIGGESDCLCPHGRLPQSLDAWFVSETDESDGSLLNYSPEYGFILNLDRDHLDFYKSDDQIEDVFVRFAHETKKKLFCSADNTWVMKLRNRDFSDRSITYGFNPLSDYRIIYRQKQSFAVQRYGRDFGNFNTRLLGKHNISNTCAVIAFLAELGISAEEIQRGIGTFFGVGRRQEVLFSNDKYSVLDDYGHHPAEIAATISAIRECLRNDEEKSGRLIVAFQPHRFSRTKLLLEGFAHCFTGADLLFLTDVYAASETPIPGISGECIARAVHDAGQNVTYCNRLDDICAAVESQARPGDVILFLGAGDITKQAHKYADHLRQQTTRERES